MSLLGLVRGLEKAVEARGKELAKKKAIDDFDPRNDVSIVARVRAATGASFVSTELIPLFKTSSSASRACRKLVSSKLVTVEPHSVGVANRGKKLHKYFWVDGNPKEVAK